MTLMPAQHNNAPQTVWFAARDPSSLQAIRPLLKAMDEQTNHFIYVFLESPALELNAQGSDLWNRVEIIPVLPFSSFLQQRNVESESEDYSLSEDDWVQLMNRWVKAHEFAHESKRTQNLPGLVITGVSGPGVGVDEMLLFMASKEKIPSLAIQSSWGDFNREVPALPEYALCIDEGTVARNRTHAPSVATTAVGSLRHVDYHGLKVEKLRRSVREHLLPLKTSNLPEDAGALSEACSEHKDNKTPLFVVWLGQPLHGLDGYYRTLNDFLDALGSDKFQDHNIVLGYRPHPKETPLQQAHTQDCISRIFTHWVDLSDLSFAEAAAAADCVVSCFSSGGFDSVYLNEKSSFPFSSVLYLFYDAQIQDWFSSNTHQTDIILVKRHLALGVKELRQLPSQLEAALNPKTREALWREARLTLPQVDDVVERSMQVVQTILSQCDNEHSER